MDTKSEIQDEYGCLRNNYAAAMAVRNQLQAMGAAAFSLAAGHGTMFHLTMVDLSYLIVKPQHEIENIADEKDLFLRTVMTDNYSDGSNYGLAIAIDRFKAYAIGWGHAIGEPGYLAQKWIGSYEVSVTPSDLWPFFNTILTGENYYEKPQPWLERLGMTEADIGQG